MMIWLLEIRVLILEFEQSEKLSPVALSSDNEGMLILGREYKSIFKI